MKFGERLRALREEQRWSQKELGQRAKLQQSKISRIESGEKAASAEVIDRLAAVFGRIGRELVRGTDRQDHYLAKALTEEEAAQERQGLRREEYIAKGTPVLVLRITYERIYAMFEAVYGGRYVEPVVHGEGLYLEMHLNCQKILTEVEELSPGISERIHFPDHVESRYPGDVLDGWQMFDREEVQRSLRELLELEVRYCRELTPSFEDVIVRHFQIDQVDRMIDQLRAERIEAEEDWIVKNGLR